MTTFPPMSESEESLNPPPEIGHVLFIDVVGYSRLRINAQRTLIQELTRIVSDSPSFRNAERHDKLIRLPTGDGMALVFLNAPDAPAQCAFEIDKRINDSNKALSDYHVWLSVRMGIHSGPICRIVDINGRPNVAGAGINLAQRVMDCGDGGHILLSRHVAEDLEHYDAWQPHLHDLGECEVKHGVRLSIVNLYADDLGNRDLPKIFAIQLFRSLHSGERAIFLDLMDSYAWVRSEGQICVAMPAYTPQEVSQLLSHLAELNLIERRASDAGASGNFWAITSNGHDVARANNLRRK